LGSLVFVEVSEFESIAESGIEKIFAVPEHGLTRLSAALAAG